MTAPKPKVSGSKPESPKKTAAPKGPAFKIHPDRAHEALEVLAAYVAERVDYAKKENIANTVEAVKVMHGFKKLAEAVGERVKSPLELAYDTMRFTIVPTFMEDEEITKITVDDVGRVSVSDDLRVTVEDKEALREWLVANELEDMITETVNTQTLTAFVRNRMKEGKTQDGKGLPKDNILRVTPFTRAAITKA